MLTWLSQVDSSHSRPNNIYRISIPHAFCNQNVMLYSLQHNAKSKIIQFKFLDYFPVSLKIQFHETSDQIKSSITSRMKSPIMSRKDSYIYNTKRDMLVSYTTNFCIEKIFQKLYSSPNLWLFLSSL